MIKQIYAISKRCQERYHLDGLHNFQHCAARLSQDKKKQSVERELKMKSGSYSSFSRRVFCGIDNNNLLISEMI